MNVQKILRPIIFLVWGAIGCDVQHGRFITTGEKSQALFQAGSIDIVEGYSDDNEAIPQDLIYVLAICPDVKEHGSSSRIEMGKYLTTLNYSWKVDTGEVGIQIQWNRNTDIVEVGDKKFDRNKGNILVVQRKVNGKIISQQLPGLGTHASFSGVLNYVQQQLTNDQMIASLKLRK